MADNYDTAMGSRRWLGGGYNAVLRASCTGESEKNQFALEVKQCLADVIERRLLAAGENASIELTRRLTHLTTASHGCTRDSTTQHRAHASRLKLIK